MEILKKIVRVKIEKEIIIVDDGSEDGTQEILRKINKKKFNISKIVFNKKNKGKGFAIKKAQRFIQGQYVIIQDADLEYDPNDYIKILKKFNSDDKIKCVYGSRVLKGGIRKRPKNILFLFTIFANKILTLITNKLYSQKLTDAHTCYKAFETKIFQKINIKSKGFEFCPEMTAKISNMKIDIHEVPVNYFARTYSEGKKISFLDGFYALKTLFRYC